VPPDHVGAILGVDVGMCWKTRLQVSEKGVHRPHVAGMAGKSAIGCPSLVLSGGYPYDEDRGEEFVYTGCSGRDLSGNDKVIYREEGYGNRKDRSLRMIEVEERIKKLANSVEGREGEKLRQLLETLNHSKHALVTAVEEAFKCPICQLAAVRPACGPCGHVICSGDCLAGLISAAEIAYGSFLCALCRAQVKPGECKKNNTLKTTLRLIMPGYGLSRQ